MLECWLTGLAEGLQRRAAAVPGQLDTAKRVAGRALAPGGRARDSFFAPEGKPGARSTQRAGPGATRTGRLRAVPRLSTTPPVGARGPGGDPHSAQAKASPALCKGQRDARRAPSSSNHAPARRGRGSNRERDASDDEAAAPAPAAPEVDAAAEAERATGQGRGGTTTHREATILKARAAEIVRKERMSKGDAAERFGNL